MASPELSEELAFTYCVRRLTSAPHTEHNLRTKLRERGYEDGVIDAVLARLRRIGYVDDAQFAVQWVRSRARTKALAEPLLRQELRQKGLDDELIEAALREAGDGADQERRALELLERKIPRTLPTDRAELDKLKRRLGGILARKGYDGSRVWRLVDVALSDAAEVASASVDE